MKSVRFIRALGIKNIHDTAMIRYGLDEQALGIPDSVFHNPMNLIPVSEMSRWLLKLEFKTGDPDIVLNVTQNIELGRLGAAGRWMFSGHDLSSTIRRINYGIRSLQSGAFMAGEQKGSLIKWYYDNTYVSSDVKVHDSVRVAVFMMKVLREYLGKGFVPKRVMLSGSRVNKAAYQAYFGCEVGWNHYRTEIWLHSDQRLATQLHRTVTKNRLAMSFSDLDEFINMPDPEDELKVIYEVVKYSCHFGLPNLMRVSGILGVSQQHFQRLLHARGLNFSTVCGYVLSNVAVELISRHVPLEQVADRLGYTNITSFNRMFKRHRGLTPLQYIQRFQDAF